MSRVDKGGRSFRPLAKLKQLPTQTPSTNTQALSSSSTHSLTDHTTVLFIPQEPSSPPLFIPEAETSLSNPEYDQSSSSICPPSQTTTGSPQYVQSKIELSAAAKMKLKAQVARANRAAGKSNKSNSFHCLSHKPQLGDIPVPLPTSTISSNSRRRSITRDTPLTTEATNQPWSPPIDPLLAMATFVDDTTTRPTTNSPVYPDVLVSNKSTHHTLPAALSVGSNSFPSTTTDHPSTVQSSPKSKSKRAPKKIICNPPLPHESNQEDISPRLKRKKHLEELRKKKKLAVVANLNQTQDQQDTDQLGALSERCASRYKRRNLAKIKKSKEAKQRGKENIVKDQQTGSETDSDTPIDPQKVAMSELTNPHHCKGQTSQTLQARLKLIIERRAREKNERMVAREENKKLARQALLDRSLKLKKNLEQDNVSENQQDEPVDTNDKNNNNDEQDDGDNQPDEETRNNDQAIIINEKDNNKKLMKEYGLEDLNSDSDMEDLEEVIFDEFTNIKKVYGSIGKKSIQSMQQNNSDDEEEEEIVEENFEENDYAPQGAQYAPQLRVVDGQIVLDQDSLEVNRCDQSPQLDEMEVVEESDSTRLINSQTWSKAVRGERWSTKETSLFYDALRLFGSDFEMITQLFPGRTRRQIRAKWNREEKSSPQEITDALMGKKKPNLNQENELTTIEEEESAEVETLITPTHLESFSQYAKIVGIDCIGPIPIDPMDKWRDKERLEWNSNSDLIQSKTHLESSNDLVLTDDDDESLIVQENTSGWGEVDG